MDNNSGNAPFGRKSGGKKVFIIFLCFVFVYFLSVSGKDIADMVSKKIFGPDVISNDSLREFVSKENKKLPIEDRENNIILNKLSAYEKTLQFEYTIINFDKDKFTQDNRNWLINNIKKSACRDKLSLKFLKAGVFIAYNYSDESGNFIDNIMVSPSDCGY